MDLEIAGPMQEQLGPLKARCRYIKQVYFGPETFKCTTLSNRDTGDEINLLRKVLS